MPTYEYVCTKCNHQFEHFQSMKDDPLAVCPPGICPQKKWGKGKVKKLIGAGAGLIFKGSGFYITDYRSEGYKSAAKKDTTPAATSTGSSSSAAAPAATSGSTTSSASGTGSSKPASGGTSAATK
jgi:putative FmdB family regulatory protein